MSRTPESLLARSDSKNPATTCQAITTSGERCRRSNLLATNPQKGNLSRNLDSIASNLDIYCWQHARKANSPLASPVPRPNSRCVRRQSSIDTLLERLGVLDITEKTDSEPLRKVRREPGGLTSPRATPSSKFVPRPRPEPSLFSTLCCAANLDDDEDDYFEIVRHSKRVNGNTKSQATTQSEKESKTSRVMFRRDELIPPGCSADIASRLLAELAKPVTTNQEGYIYIYWLTDEASPSKEYAETLASAVSPSGRSPNLPPGANPKQSNRPKTILVKIGRTKNVHQRLLSWSRQCGYQPLLIRFYPYVAPSEISLEQPESTVQVRKVAFSHRVERLIHIELSNKQVKKDKCEACGKAHREWFEIEASRDELQALDSIIRKWVQWAETLQSQDADGA